MSDQLATLNAKLREEWSGNEAYSIFNHNAEITFAACNHGEAISEVAARSLPSHDAGIALATCNHGGDSGNGSSPSIQPWTRTALAIRNYGMVTQGMTTHSLFNHGAGIALGTCNHGGVTGGW